MRMTGVHVSADRPQVRRSGYLGTDLYDMVALAEDVVLVSRGVPAVTAAVIARVRSGNWPEGRSSSLAAPELRALVETAHRAPLVLYVPRPLSLPPGFATSVLLARQRVLAAMVVPEGEEELDVSVALRGEFPDGAERNFRALVESVAESALGGALGIREGLQTLSVQAEADSVTLRMRLRVGTLVAGLRLLFTAELEELLAPPEER